VRTLLISLVFLLVAAPAAAAQDILATAADAMRSEQVYVADDVAGFTPEIASALRAQAQQEAPDEVFVAVLPASAGDSPEQVLRELMDRVGRPGAYAVVMDSRFRASGNPENVAVQAANDAFAAHRDEGPAAVLRDFIARVGDPESGDGGGGEGALILLGLAGAGGAALLISRRQKRRREAAELAEVKENARDDLVALGDDIRALDLDVQMPGLSDATRADYERAVNAYDRADTALEQARSPQDMQPVGEALEEGRWAMESTRARLEGREPPERRPPCFFDPRHGPSSRDVEWAPMGGATRSVPACEADAQRVERGEDPGAREYTIGGRRTPYWQAGPAYAPFMGGFYGGGLLPGLFIGSALGGMWDGPGGGDFGGGDFGGGFGGGDFGGGDFGGGDF
jgi:hypothetical protein